MSNDFVYHCYRCGTKNKVNLPKPIAPDYHHTSVTCKSCSDSTHVLLSHCPNCERYVYFIDDMSIPDTVSGFARYMVHHMQALIDRAAAQGVSLSIDTPDNYPISATCPCGTTFAIELPIPDLDE
ncbi:MAG: hypothetical protein ACFFE6_13985 [Candidatus Thorarchaeota archaeon]